MGLHTEKPRRKTTGVASGAVTGRRFINYSDAQCNAKGQLAKGIAMDSAIDGQTFAIIVDGTGLITAGEALGVGDKVTTNGLGKAVIAGRGEYINGVVMRAQSLADQLVEIRVSGNTVSTVPTTTTTSTSTSTTTSSSSTTSTSSSTTSSSSTTASTISTTSTTMTTTTTSMTTTTSTTTTTTVTTA